MEHLDAAYLALAAGNYTAASGEIEMASAQESPSIFLEAIYLTGLLYADPRNPAEDMSKAYETLQKIEMEHPGYRRGGEVRILSDLLHRLQTTEFENDRLRLEVVKLEKKLAAERSSVQQLKKLLEKMKEIDLELVPEE